MPITEVAKPFLGISPPIDERPPNEADVASSEALEWSLKELGVFESEGAVRRRVRFLSLSLATFFYILSGCGRLNFFPRCRWRALSLSLSRPR